MYGGVLLELPACPYDRSGGHELAEYGAERGDDVPVPGASGECSGEFGLHEYRHSHDPRVSAGGPDELGGFSGFHVPDQLDMDTKLDERDGL